MITITFRKIQKFRGMQNSFVFVFERSQIAICVNCLADHKLPHKTVIFFGVQGILTLAAVLCWRRLDIISLDLCIG